MLRCLNFKDNEAFNVILFFKTKLYVKGNTDIETKDDGKVNCNLGTYGDNKVDSIHPSIRVIASFRYLPKAVIPFQHQLSCEVPGRCMRLQNETLLRIVRFKDESVSG